MRSYLCIISKVILPAYLSFHMYDEQQNPESTKSRSVVNFLEGSPVQASCGMKCLDSITHVHVDRVAAARTLNFAARTISFKIEASIQVCMKARGNANERAQRLAKAWQELDRCSNKSILVLIYGNKGTSERTNTAPLNRVPLWPFPL